MTTANLTSRKIAKLKFFGIYALSILLIVIVFSSFLSVNGNGIGRDSNGIAAKPDHRKSVNDLLHRQMDRLQNACAAYAQNSGSKEAMDALWQEDEAFSTVVDSIRKASASISEASERMDVETALDAFRREAKKQVSFVKSIASLPRDTASAGAGPSEEELNELKGILLQKEQRILDMETQQRQLLEAKDKTITDLQNRVNAQPAVPQQRTATTAAGLEWKDKYDKLKATTDKLREANNENTTMIRELKASYKTVVDDNKRLVGQLQTLKTRN